MPVLKVQVNEYQCSKCRYRWINRVNGRNGPLPERCAKCKKYGWNDEGGNITPEENGLRRRIKGYEELYAGADWSGELTERFFKLDPRPTVKELRRVVYPPGLLIGLTSQNKAQRWNEVTLRSEARTRQDIMQQIINERSQPQG